MQPVNLSAAPATLDRSWSPLTVATLNDSDVRVEVLLLEPSVTVNTGDTPSELAAPRRTTS